MCYRVFGYVAVSLNVLWVPWICYRVLECAIGFSGMPRGPQVGHRVLECRTRSWVMLGDSQVCCMVLRYAMWWLSVLQHPQVCYKDLRSATGSSGCAMGSLVVLQGSRICCDVLSLWYCILQCPTWCSGGVSKLCSVPALQCQDLASQTPPMLSQLDSYTGHSTDPLLSQGDFGRRRGPDPDYEAPHHSCSDRPRPHVSLLLGFLH